MEQDKHIVKSYDDEMKEINNNILDIGSLVEDQLKRALFNLLLIFPPRMQKKYGKWMRKLMMNI